MLDLFPGNILKNCYCEWIPFSFHKISQLNIAIMSLYINSVFSQSSF